MNKLLIIIYFVFISLGLPDSVLGTAWPTMHQELHLVTSAAGLIAMVVSVCTILSSLQTIPLIKRFGIGKLVLFSVLATAIGLLGYSTANYYWMLLLFAIPLGLGAGAIDTSVNDYVALHYKAHHMNWLHAFWGIGATVGPIIMGILLSNNLSWRMGYLVLGIIQLLLVLLLTRSIPLWKKIHVPVAETGKRTTTLRQVITKPGVIFSLLAFIFYVGTEASIGLWGSTFLVNAKGIHVNTAAFITSTYYASITVGRLIAGFMTFRFGNRFILYVSETLLVIGVVLLMILPGQYSLVGFALTGLGSAAIFPTMLQETPRRFGTDFSTQVMSLQVGLAYVGTTCLPPLLGVISQYFGMAIFPYILGIFSFVLLAATILLEKGVRQTHTS